MIDYIRNNLLLVLLTVISNAMGIALVIDVCFVYSPFVLLVFFFYLLLLSISIAINLKFYRLMIEDDDLDYEESIKHARALYSLAFSDYMDFDIINWPFCYWYSVYDINDAETITQDVLNDLAEANIKTMHDICYDIYNQYGGYVVGFVLSRGDRYAFDQVVHELLNNLNDPYPLKGDKDFILIAVAVAKPAYGNSSELEDMEKIIDSYFKAISSGLRKNQCTLDHASHGFSHNIDEKKKIAKTFFNLS